MMKVEDDKKIPQTQHKKIYDKGEQIENTLTVLDSPDDRITEQKGHGITIVKNDNPDDIESQ
ncbi:hypothetical protein [Phosphitispora fastidiosa]|uniref:hypothetical protein n=1 Tax=Phosphitispora fastidiosa TaxID=2837202 RepID=UPI001E5C4C8D|nr:hypothetical protein [Phosphitispora fastidiosa]MBU7008579.1 hypothetical protein [Phosphitispora fastidiosa]